MEVDDFAHAGLAAGLEFADVQVDGGPPAGEGERIADHAGDFVTGTGHAPAGDEVVIVTGHAGMYERGGPPDYAVAGWRRRRRKASMKEPFGSEATMSQENATMRPPKIMSKK